MTAITLADVEFGVRSIANTVTVNEKYFGDLDSVVGDGDFGFSLARGFEAVLAGWDDYSRDDIGSFLQGVALTISRRIGGTSGPIWGTAFLRAAVDAKGRTEIRTDETVSMLRAAIEGIKARGKAEVGDKTLLDVLVPMTDAIEAATSGPLLPLAAISARSAAEGASALQARRGRASYSGERSIGVPDAGAIAIAVIVERLTQDWTQHSEAASTAEGGSER